MTRFILSQQNSDGSTSLYATDGTAAGTTDLDMSRFGFAGGSNFIEFDGKTAFLGDGVPSPGSPYTYVYATDGTASGTTGTLVVADGGPLIPRNLWVVGNKLLASGFSQDSPAALYASSDGVNFTEIESGVGTDTLTVAHGIGYFAADLNFNGTDSLWRTDGTAAGTYSITPPGVALNPTDIASVGNGRAVFVNNNVDGTTTLWATNGTAAGTYALTKNPALGNDIRPEYGIATAGGRAIFTAIDAANNVSVWSTDGTSAGTTELIIDGPADAPVRRSYGYTTWGNKVIFTDGSGVVVTDGTKSGTINLSARGEASNPDFFAGLGNRIFIASIPFNVALFTSDGTTAGTLPLFINGLQSVTGDFTVVNGQVVFAGIDTSGKEALFSSDGTTSGSHELSLPSGFTINPNNLPAIGALPEIIAPGPLTGVLPNPLHTGVETVTGTGGVAGLQLERITQGTYNSPGSTGWVKATVAANGNWSAQLTFDKPGMLAHVYAANGGSSTVVDLVNGTPVASTSASASLKSLAASVLSLAASDMSASAVSSKLAVTQTIPETTQSASALSLMTLHVDAVVVSDHLKLLHHSA